MTAYNRASLLPATLDSIFCQDYSFEVIVVEDGCDGKTEEVCKKYPVRYFSRRNRPEGWCNPSIPNNIGIRQAKGEVLILLNAENVHLNKNSIRILSEKVLMNPKTSVFASVWAANQLGNFHQWYVHPKHNRRPVFFCQAVPLSTVISIRGFDEDYKYYGYDDNDFSRRLGQLGFSFIFLEDVVLKHQWHVSAPHTREQALINAKLYDSKVHENPIRNRDREWGQL